MIPAPVFPHVHFTHLQKLLILFLKIPYYVALFFSKKQKMQYEQYLKLQFRGFDEFCARL